ncbi:hypothetical protein MADE_000001020725 [Alteromonas mediterranea DE]|uniref:Uncharacterized protein n=1 Tax=Alteromonas mediterranea (strain DSM 17117 / CIP 110805 / LMG 28347 / Deep ecotype) TaxID=1774373 RepID=T2DMC2_ALTMD|nr:hypothetical protein MADE_000001020725 [Alteromonas mediterranea DE]
MVVGSFLSLTILRNSSYKLGAKMAEAHGASAFLDNVKLGLH